MDELIDMATIKEKGTFDNPFVLSFLANTCFTGSFVPDGYYTPYEFGRLRFVATGQLAELSTDQQKLIIGGLILCRGLCKELFTNAQKYFSNLKASPQGFANLELLAAVIYQVFIAQVDRLEHLPDNTSQVTLNEEPAPMDRGIDWKEGSYSEGDGILLGAPDVSSLGYDEGMMDNKMDKFLDNMLRFVKMQGENERLPLHKKKIDLLNGVASKSKRVDAELYQHLTDTIRQKDKALKVPG